MEEIRHGKYVIDINSNYLEAVYNQTCCRTPEEKMDMFNRIRQDIIAFLNGKGGMLFRTVFLEPNTNSLQRSFSITDFETGKEVAIPMAVEDYAELLYAQMLKEKKERGETAPSKIFTIDGYHMHIVCEVVYPEYTNDFERELLDIITSNACSRIKTALDADNDAERKDLEDILLDKWMSILGSAYRDHTNCVELSKYNRQSQTIYKAKYISDFIYK